MISLSLKSMKQAGYESAFHCLKEEIAREFKKHPQIIQNLNSEDDRTKYKLLMNHDADDEEYLTALKFLFRMSVYILRAQDGHPDRRI